MTVADADKGFDATKALEKHSETFLGTLKLTEIHLSNMDYIETFEGERIFRKEFKPKEGQKWHYAADLKLKFTV